MASSSNSNANAEFAAALDAFWRSDDFTPLKCAGAQVNAVLRQDEQDADLHSKIGAGPLHLYFAAENKSGASTIGGRPTISSATPATGIITPGSTGSSTSASQQKLPPPPPPPPLFPIQHRKSVPLPPELDRRLKNVRFRSIKGLFAQAGIAWMTVDDTLYLWNYGNATTTEFCSFTVPSGQCVVTAGLVHPKKGTFKSNVEWCLVVTAPDEVFLLGLVRSAPSAAPTTATTTSPMRSIDYDNSSLKLKQTTFSLRTDDDPILSITGTANGRIFLGTDHGNLYEMMYSVGDDDDHKKVANGSVKQQLEAFYDQGKDIPETISERFGDSLADKVVKLGKRAFRAFENGDSPKRKCRKVIVSTNISSSIRTVVPEFLINTTSFLFSGRIGFDSMITQMVVDEARQCLYTLSESGWICVYDLASTSQHHIRLTAVMDGARTTRLYLEAVSRGQMFPPSTGHSSSTIGAITFLGGGSSAQAGVGGMEGARSILKLADYRRDGGSGVAPSSDGSSGILKPISIHVVSPTESSRLTLMAVTKGGLRLYLSSLAPHVRPNASRYGSGSRYQCSNPLSPWNRITLCHVRAPPPLDHSIQDCSVAAAGDPAAASMVGGGIIPRVEGFKVAQVDASAYRQGVHVIAVLDPFLARQSSSHSSSSTINTGLQRHVGDVIVATCPDAMIRKKVTPSNTSSVTLPLQQGGLVETMSLPMASAYNGSLNDFSAVLPGGRVWAIAPVSTKESAVMTLMTNSKTPTETELCIGLPPAYFPPSKILARDFDQTKALNGRAPSLNGPRASTSTDVVARSLPSRKTPFEVGGKMVINLFLSRPFHHGLTSDEPLEEDSARDFDAPRSYRISKHDCSGGFSTTAGESSSKTASTVSISSAKSLRNTRSARLGPWLLRPAAVPLSYLSTLYFYQGRDMVALNAGGLHYFGHTTILSRLAEALISASGNFAYDPTTFSFFSAYGYKEGCCMCLALAIGCVPTVFSEKLRKLASAAVLARAGAPKLVWRPEQSGTLITDFTTDELVPQGYNFQASALSEGLTALFSRLVRPIWHKPAVVVTEGREVKLPILNEAFLTPAKVEILLDEATREEIGGFLRNLLNLMKGIFSDAVRTVPGASQQQGNMMDVVEKEENQAILTSLLPYNSHMRGGGGSSTMPLTAFEAEHIARLLEGKNIHSLYRLLARVVQLLNLMSLLRRAQGMAELREVDWGLLHGLTIAQLVQTSEGQERLESLLNSLVTSSASSRSQTAVQSAQADQLAGLFADQCYLFFSPGSHFAYLGLRKANEALDQSMSQSNRISLATQASKHFLQAAQYWHSAPLITGRVLHTKEKETFCQIALRAMHYGSPLAKAVEALMQLEDVGSVVKICMITAANFKSGRVINARSSEQLGGQRTYELSWEQNLYHKRHNGQDSAAGISTTQSSPSQISAYGTEVTSKDAIDTCHALIFYHLSMLFNARPSLADNMVAACAAASDVSFLEAFFSYLLESDHADTLLQLNSASLDKWLRERKDPDLLWRFYDVRGRHREAGQVALDRASDAECKLPLRERIEWLSRSVTSYKIASEQGQQRGRFEVGFNEIVAGKAKEANDSLRLARLQNRILTSVDSSGPDEMTLELREKLAYTLVPVTELYNDFAAALGMSEECLLILHACHHDEAETIEMLWKNVFCEVLLPCSTRNETTYHILQTFVADQGLGDEITFLSETEQSDSLMIFENGLWEKPLVQRVVDLGKKLYGTGADYVFPIEFILSRMEELRQSVPKLTPGWALLALADAGVPFLVIMHAYESIAQNDCVLLVESVETDKYIKRVAAFLELFEYWLSLAQSNTRTSGGLRNAAYKELSRAIASGRLLSKIDTIKARMGVLPVAASMMERLQAIEESIRFIV